MNISQGAFLGDKLVPKEEFIAIVKERVQQFRAPLVGRLLYVLTFQGDNRNIGQAYREWELIQKQFFGNLTETSLMVMANFTSTGKGTYHQYMSPETTNIYYTQHEGELVQDTGLINSEGKFALSVAVAEEFDQHYNDLETTVSSPMDNLDRMKVLKGMFTEVKGNQKKIFKERLYQYENKRKSPSYRNVIWHNTWPAAFRGQLADAYLNHLGAMHQQIFNSGTISLEEMSNIDLEKSVQQEEGAYFFQRLVDSTNSSSWMSGGDLNIVDINHQVLFKIQLKTTNRDFYGKVSSSRFFTLIQKLVDDLQGNNIQQLAENLYEEVKTSAFVYNVEKKVQDFSKGVQEEFQKNTKTSNIKI